MICQLIQNLINYGISNELIAQDDSIFVRNQLMHELQISEWKEPQSLPEMSLEEILDGLLSYACEQGIIIDSSASRDLLDTKLMGHLTKMPHEVKMEFFRRYKTNARSATDWYYKFSRDTNYVRSGRIAKNICWTYKSDYGVFDITINLSKPEKDPRDIAAALNSPKTNYPKCQLCIENTGYAGRIAYPARQNLRPIPFRISDKEWFFQYSPYGYFNEHCIIFNGDHTPMSINPAVFEKLFDALDFLPHYFIGSNADLPIVGGSILTHEHSQGGRYTFAMERAGVEKEFLMPKTPGVWAGIVKWPMSVIRLQCENRTVLANACCHILKAWRGYSDPEVGIFAETDGVLHNTITPIARMRGNRYECDLVLRNNLTDKDHPLGIFHPNSALHHIKKENIGLIEVMGLAVLPERLARDIELMEKALCRGEDISGDKRLECHSKWFDNVRKRHPEADSSSAGDILKQEIGAVFEQVLLDAGVFKRTSEGLDRFNRFIEYLNRDSI